MFSRKNSGSQIFLDLVKTEVNNKWTDPVSFLYLPTLYTQQKGGKKPVDQIDQLVSHNFPLGGFSLFGGMEVRPKWVNNNKKETI